MENIASATTPSVAFITLGCSKNEVDTDRMKALVLASVYALVEDVDKADVVIVNTCSFLTEATEEAVEVIFDVLDGDALKGRGAHIIVAGCMPSRYGDELVSTMPEVDAFLPAAEEDTILSVIERITGVAAGFSGSRDVLRTVDAPFAYVKISDGCNRFCTYCTIPLIRGRYHSRPLDEILAEVRGLLDAGVREIVLIGQDTGIWGTDLPGAGNLASLLSEVAALSANAWIRVMYLQPEGITDELLDVVAKTPNICDYFDIPLQHASKRILNEMNRHGSTEEYLALVEHIRKKVPGAVLRTTVIAGFPGETRQDAKELIDFLSEARFDYTGVFVYSQEDGTVAGMRDDQVLMRTRKARAQRLRDLCDTIGFACTSKHVDKTVDVLVEGHESDEEGADLVGRWMGQAPDVDGCVHLDRGEIGEVVSVHLVDSFCYELEGEVL